MNLHKIDCPYCGANIEADIENRKMVYCTYCGKQILIDYGSNDIIIDHNININQHMSQHIRNDAEILKEKNRHKEKKLLVLVGCFFVLICVLVGLINHNNPRDSQNDNGNLIEQQNIDKNESKSSKLEKDPYAFDGEINKSDGINGETYSFSFIDYKQFDTFWNDGQYRCPNDIPSGKYVLLPLYAPFVTYISTDPNEKLWNGYELFKEIDLLEGQYIYVDSAALLVPEKDVDKNDLKKYGVFKVGTDILPGDYKIVTITDNFTSDIGIGMYGIMGGYQISKNSPTGEVIKSEMLFSGSEYITVNEGEYLTIVNAIISKAN